VRMERRRRGYGGRKEGLEERKERGVGGKEGRKEGYRELLLGKRSRCFVSNCTCKK
jgi:hypothetical protein